VRRIAGLVVLALSMIPMTPADVGAQSAQFKVVINSAQQATALSKAQVSRFFLKKETTWAGGQAVMPVDLVDKSQVRGSFSQAVHGRDVSAIKSYWQRMIFSGTAVPPAEKANEDEVIAYVKANPGAIGYVAADTAIPNGVRVVTLTE
jgi:ABC-type phosphate transport system substrate-binding protein